MQRGAAAQAKLVRVLEGSVLDIAVDLRKGSPSFGQHYAIELTADNHKQFFVPAGFAHGFVVLSEAATFFYKVDKFYEPGNEVGIMYNDKDLNINWQLADDEIILSEKDKTLGSFADYAASL
jgi:dTDP-4-dehydrorhamnose 3,5-epimerase